MKHTFFPFIALLSFLITGHNSAQAQVSDTTSLYKAMRTQDSLLFDIGYNECDMRTLESVVSDNFEFYHDKGGIQASKKEFIHATQVNICQQSFKARRYLVPGTMQVFPMKRNNGELYGALVMGIHRFYIKDSATAAERVGDEARFTVLWQLENGVWKLSRGISYDHILAQEKAAAQLDIANDSSFAKWLKENNVPAVGIGVIHQGKLQSVKVFGELKKGDPAPYNTIFNVASITKTITTTVVLKLVASGQWKLDEPLDKYWIDPDLANDPRHSKLTTRLVLSHQTGFPNWRWMHKSGKLSFEFDPGTKYQYSGEGFEYLRKAIENKFHIPLEKLADSLIFKPLGMTDTRLIWDEEKVNARFAVGYDPKGNAYENNRNTKANAADDMLTTVEDYGRFVAALIDGKVLPASIYKEMITHQVKTKNGKYFGLGWEVYDFGNGQYGLGHGGADKGVHAQVLLLPQSGDAVIVFTSVDDGWKTYEPIFKYYLKPYGQQFIDVEMAKE